MRTVPYIYTIYTYQECTRYGTYGIYNFSFFRVPHSPNLHYARQAKTADCKSCAQLRVVDPSLAAVVFARVADVIDGPP